MPAVTRRQMLRLLGVSSAGLIVAGCGPATQPTAAPVAPTNAPVGVPTVGSASVPPGTVARTSAAATATTATATPATAATAAPTTPAVDRTIRLAGGSFGYPSPFAMTRGGGYLPMSLLFDTLVWRDAEKVQPWLVREWTISEDNRTYRFRLRDGLQWADGQPVTADDALFSAEYIAANPIPWTIRLDLIEAGRKIDDSTFEFRLKETYAPFLDNDMASLPIIPRHIWGEVKDPTKKQDEGALIGTGPYRLERYDKEQGAYLYAARPDYYLGRPYFTRVEMVPVGDILLALLKGDVDAGSPDVSAGLTDETLAPFTGDPKFGVLAAPGESTTALYFNVGKGAPYDDPNLRHAVAYAIQRDDLVKRILQGKGKPGNPGWLAPSSPWVNPNVEQYPYDPAKAKGILAANGYLDRDNDGVRETPQGQPLRLEMILSSATPRPGELVRDALKAIGIDLVLRPLDATALRQQATAGNYTLALIGLSGLGGDPDFVMSFFDSRLTGAQLFTKAQGYRNPEFEATTDQQRQTLDPARRKELVFTMQDILARDLAVLPLYYPDRLFIYNKHVFDNWYYTPGGWAGGNPGAVNKAVLVTGQKTGLTVRS